MQIIIYLIVFIVKALDGTLSNYRLILLKEGNRIGVLIVNIFASIFWLISVALVVDNISTDPFIVFSFVLGLVVGNYIGVLLYKSFKSGQILTTVIINEKNENLIDQIKANGFKITTFSAEGKDSKKKVIMIAVPRKKQDFLLNTIKTNDESNFVINENVEEAVD